MNRSKLGGFIDRYNLGGEVESVMLKSSDSQIVVKMISDDKTLLGTVSVNDTDFPIGEFGIYTTSQFKQLLSVLDENISVATVDSNDGAIGLKFADKQTKMQYMLAAPSVIPAVPDLKALPEFEAEITLDDEFVNKFIKSKGALSDSDTFTFIHKDGKGEIWLYENDPVTYQTAPLKSLQITLHYKRNNSDYTDWDIYYGTKKEDRIKATVTGDDDFGKVVTLQLPVWKLDRMMIWVEKANAKPGSAGSTDGSIRTIQSLKNQMNAEFWIRQGDLKVYTENPLLKK